MNERKFSILHIASDEKFIDAANYIFEKAFPQSNDFIITHPRFNRKLTFVKKGENIEILYYGRNLVRVLTERVQKYNCIILHGITELNSTVFLASKVKNKFIGIFWGAELYTQENFPEKSLVGELTASIKLNEPDKLKERIKKIISQFIYNKPLIIKDATKSAAYELVYFGVPYEEEFDFLKEKKLISANCRLIPFTYYPLEFIMRGNDLSIITGNDIFLGNSASFTNNHLEAFQILKQMNIGNRKIVVPLSYGNSLYAEYIQKEGSKLFNAGFKPLRTFMPLNEYTRELQSCGITIMNHFRQQAVGNILTMLWLGSKVYLNESNTVFHFLRRIGVKIFSIEKDLTKENPYALSNLSKNEMEQNRLILKKTISEENIIKFLKEGIHKYFL
jgi:dTDP-N-acetylfucosamine:lipid II N-acetylfucosaminyltransferase